MSFICTLDPAKDKHLAPDEIAKDPRAALSPKPKPRAVSPPGIPAGPQPPVPPVAPGALAKPETPEHKLPDAPSMPEKREKKD